MVGRPATRRLLQALWMLFREWRIVRRNERRRGERYEGDYD